MNRLRPRLRWISCGLLLCLVSLPGVGLAQSEAGENQVPAALAMIGDALVVRPLGIAATLVGLAAFIVSLPFSALGGNVGDAAQTLVVEPAEYTFSRPLGDL